jgi:hypothetical protein
VNPEPTPLRVAAKRRTPHGLLTVNRVAASLQVMLAARRAARFANRDRWPSAALKRVA